MLESPAKSAASDNLHISSRGEKENTSQIAEQFPLFDSVSSEMRQEVDHSSRPPVTGARGMESATPWSQISV